MDVLKFLEEFGCDFTREAPSPSAAAEAAHPAPSRPAERPTSERADLGLPRGDGMLEAAQSRS